jgi:hypothetical protein
MTKAAKGSVPVTNQPTHNPTKAPAKGSVPVTNQPTHNPTKAPVKAPEPDDPSGDVGGMNTEPTPIAGIDNSWRLLHRNGNCIAVFVLLQV